MTCPPYSCLSLCLPPPSPLYRNHHRTTNYHLSWLSSLCWSSHNHHNPVSPLSRARWAWRYPWGLSLLESTSCITPCIWAIASLQFSRIMILIIQGYSEKPMPSSITPPTLSSCSSSYSPLPPPPPSSSSNYPAQWQSRSPPTVAGLPLNYYSCLNSCSPGQHYYWIIQIPVFLNRNSRGTQGQPLSSHLSWRTPLPSIRPHDACAIGRGWRITTCGACTQASTLLDAGQYSASSMICNLDPYALSMFQCTEHTHPAKTSSGSIMPCYGTIQVLSSSPFSLRRCLQCLRLRAPSRVVTTLFQTTPWWYRLERSHSTPSGQ